MLFAHPRCEPQFHEFARRQRCPNRMKLFIELARRVIDAIILDVEADLFRDEIGCQS